jgi:hypothetical protein
MVTSPAARWAGLGRLLLQAGEEPADLVAGQGNHLASGRVAVAWLDGQEGAGEQGQDGPAVPGGPELSWLA